jgi:hypothetical protein
LDRCLSHRADLLGKVLRQSIARQSNPDNRIADLLIAALNDTADDFTAQTKLLSTKVEAKYRDQILKAGMNYSALGYALIDADGDSIEISTLRGLNERVSVAMHRYAYYGWSSFLPLNVPERAPQIRMSNLAGRELTYLEGMRVENTGLITSAFDYWRIYDCGIGMSVESFRDDWSRQDEPNPPPHLSLTWILVPFHSLLAHARLAGQELPGVARVVVRMDWRGLKGRMLAWDRSRHAAGGGKLAEDRFAKTVTLEWRDLRDDYFGTLRRVTLPFLNLFAASGWFDPETWLTPEAVDNQFKRLNVDTLKLFEDNS